MATEQARRGPPRPPPPRLAGRGSMEPSAPQEGPSMLSEVNTFQDMQKLHDIVYRHINQGLQADEIGDTTTALSSYTEGQRLLDIALRVECTKLTSCSSEQMDKAKDMQMKMNKTRQQITFRLQELQQAQGDVNAEQLNHFAESPPSYEEAMSETPSSLTDDEMMALGDSIWSDEGAQQQMANATQLFVIPDGVQIFYITPEGLVSAPSYPTSLNIVTFQDDQQAQHSRAPPAFLHVGDWMYPLIPGTSPALHTNYGAYMFPDVMSNQPGSAVGLILPETLPVQERERFEAMIRSFTVMEKQPESYRPPEQEGATAAPESAGVRQEERKEAIELEEEPQDTVSKISKGIVEAADWIAWGVGKGAEKAGEWIKVGSEKLQEKLDPEEKERKINPNVQKGVEYARQATHVTVKVTGFIVKKLCDATMALGRQLAPHVRREGEKILPKSLTKEKSDGKSTFDGVVQVAASGLKGFGTVYMCLEGAAKSLGKSLTNETVQIVKYKYGDEAGTFTENTMYAVGNAVMTGYNASNIGVKAVAKRAAKNTGKAVLEDLAKKQKEKQSSGKSVEDGAKSVGGSVDQSNRKDPPL